MTRRAILVIGAVTLVAGALRFAGLSQPAEKVFDEVYYASDGCLYAGHPFEECDLDDNAERSWVHPPLGKQIIARGIDVFGNRPFGWRAAAAVAGTVTVALVGILAFLLLGSATWAGVAALFAASEHLLFVQSRIAMLDVFLAMFIVLGFVLLVADRRRRERANEEGETLPAIRARLLLAGASFGAAMAVKWSGYLALFCALALAVGWTIRRVREGRAELREFAGVGLAFVVVPFVLYALPWIPWIADRGWSLSEWLGHHQDMLDYHATLETVKDNGEPIHPYMSRAWGWLLLLRPVAYYWQGDPSCCAEILGIGNPFIFWGSLLVIPYLLLVWLRGKRWEAGAAVLPILFQYLPWLAVSRPLFLFYMAPVAPFLALGLVFPLRDLVESRVPRVVGFAGAAAVVAAVVGVFAFFLPILTARQLSYDAWQMRIWLDPGWI